MLSSGDDDHDDDAMVYGIWMQWRCTHDDARCRRSFMGAFVVILLVMHLKMVISSLLFN